YHGRRFLTKLVHRHAGLPSVRSHTDRVAPVLRLSGRLDGVLTSRRYITYGPARSVCVGPAALFQGLIRGQLIEGGIAYDVVWFVLYEGCGEEVERWLVRR